MKARYLAVAALGMFALAGAGEAMAYDPGAPYCMRTKEGGDDCSYVNFRQCQATSRGLGTTCFANPAYAYGRSNQYYNDGYEQPRPRRRHRDRDYY